MENIEKNNIFIQNPNKKDRILVFQDKLKRHLSNEYLYIVDKKDDLENQLVQLKVEHSQKNKTLFPNIEQKDVRKYFSPLNIQDIEDDQKDEKDKQITINIDRLQDEITQFDVRMQEIREFLHDIDELLMDPDESFEYDAEDIEESASMDYEDNDKKSVGLKPEDELKEGNVIIEENNQQFGDNFSEIVDFFKENRMVYPQMLRNLYDYSDFLQEEFNQIEVLIEFNDNNIETPVAMNRNLLFQVNYNVNMVLKDYDVSTLLILGEVTAKKINLLLNYVCDSEDIEAMNVSYEIKNI